MTTPFVNQQPYLVVSKVTPLSGIFPSEGGGGSANGDTLGFEYDFAGNFAPGNSDTLAGQTLGIQQYEAEFSLLGTTFGGNGMSTFLLPNLQGAASIGVGTGPGLPAETLGEHSGSTSITLTQANLPPGAPPGGGSGLPFNPTHPSLGLTPLIAVSGVFPPREGGGSAGASFIGQVAYFEGNFTPGGWLPADGRLIPIAQNTALFSILGTTYGGDGMTDFALPDLRGRVAVGADGGGDALGSTLGSAAVTLTQANLPAPAGTDAPVHIDQPSLALNYIIATSGIFPSMGGGGGFNATIATLGQIALFAGDFAPAGWAFADGSLMPISQDTALFSILGTQYGGDGNSTFALPDLRGRTTIGAGDGYVVGQSGGSDTITLAAANIPACFVAGTRIATARGEVAVERLVVGDRVRTVSGTLRPVVWLGWRTVDLGRHPTPARVAPIRIAAHAFADGAPCRDLWLSPDHAVFAHGVLIPMGGLADGDAITREVRPPATEWRVTYWHVELDAHDVVLAEGLPCESYLETGGGAFANASVVSLHPDFATRAWEADGCAELVLAGPRVDAVRRHLAARWAAAAWSGDAVALA